MYHGLLEAFFHCKLFSLPVQYNMALLQGLVAIVTVVGIENP